MWSRQTSCGTCPLHCRCDPLEVNGYSSGPREMAWDSCRVWLAGSSLSIEELEDGTTLAYVGLIVLGSLFFSGASVSVSA